MDTNISVRDIAIQKMKMIYYWEHLESIYILDDYSPLKILIFRNKSRSKLFSLKY